MNFKKIIVLLLLPSLVIDPGMAMDVNPTEIPRSFSEQAMAVRLSQGWRVRDVTSSIWEAQGAHIRIRGPVLSQETAFQKMMTRPLVEGDSLAPVEISFLFEIFGAMKVTNARRNPNEPLLKIGKINGSGWPGTAVLDEHVSAEGLLDLLAELRGISPQERWHSTALNVVGFFEAWKKEMARLAAAASSPPLREEYIRLHWNFAALEKKARESLGVPGYMHASVRINPEVLQPREKMHAALFEETYFALTDPLATILMEGLYARFLQEASTWTDPLPSGRSAKPWKRGDWLAAARTVFEGRVAACQGDVGELRALHLHTARRLAETIRRHFEQYSKTKFQIGEILNDRKANCVGFSTLFPLYGRAIGLNVRVTDIDQSQGSLEEEEIAHAANLLMLPGQEHDPLFAAVDVTWDSYVSGVILPAHRTLVKWDALSRRWKLDPSISRHTLLSVYDDMSIPLRAMYLEWAGVSDTSVKYKGLAVRVHRRILRIDPANASALSSLGTYYASDPARRTTFRSRKSADHYHATYKAAPRDPERAFTFLQAAARVQPGHTNWPLMRSLSIWLNREPGFDRLCDELIPQFETANDFISAENAYSEFIDEKLKIGVPNREDRRVALLERGRQRYPNSQLLMERLIARHRGEWNRLGHMGDPDAIRQRAAKTVSLTHLYEAYLTQDWTDEKMFFSYRRFCLEAWNDRFVPFVEELQKDHPESDGPVLALSDYYAGLRSEDGYRRAEALLKTFLENPQAKNRVDAFHRLQLIYEDPLELEFEQEASADNPFEGRHEELLAYHRQFLVHRDPNSYAARQSMGILLADHDHYAESIPLLREVLHRHSDWTPARERLVYSLKKMGDWLGVLEHAERLLDEEHGDWQPWFDTARALHHLERFEEARERFSKIILRFTQQLSVELYWKIQGFIKDCDMRRAADASA